LEVFPDPREQLQSARVLYRHNDVGDWRLSGVLDITRVAYAQEGPRRAEIANSLWAKIPHEKVQVRRVPVTVGEVSWVDYTEEGKMFIGEGKMTDSGIKTLPDKDNVRTKIEALTEEPKIYQYTHEKDPDDSSQTNNLEFRLVKSDNHLVAVMYVDLVNCGNVRIAQVDTGAFCFRDISCYGEGTPLKARNKKKCPQRKRTKARRRRSAQRLEENQVGPYEVWVSDWTCPIHPEEWEKQLEEVLPRTRRNPRKRRQSTGDSKKKRGKRGNTRACKNRPRSRPVTDLEILCRTGTKHGASSASGHSPYN